MRELVEALLGQPEFSVNAFECGFPLTRGRALMRVVDEEQICQPGVYAAPPQPFKVGKPVRVLVQRPAPVAGWVHAEATLRPRERALNP